MVLSEPLYGASADKPQKNVARSCDNADPHADLLLGNRDGDFFKFINTIIHGQPHGVEFNRKEA